MTESTAADPIDHVVLLLMENHSFDQMLGCLDAVHDGLDGVINAATRTNADGQGGTFSPKPTTERQMLKDPHHDHPSVLRQIADDNGGFVREFTSAFPTSTADERQDVMGYYPLDFLPALHTLGRSFTVCDMWFSSLPGPTWPNRFFALTGTSMGETAMPGGTAALDPKWYTEQSQDTIFDRLDTAGKPWKVYFNDFPCSLLLTHQHSAENLAHYEKFDNFFKDAAGPEAEFPAFTFIEPRYFGEGQNDDHPPHNTMKAEKLIADTYNALRSNPDLWATTLLVVVYDEHGGFYDHVTPPPAVAPDDRTEQYDFARLGVRVPALLVSPWCDAGVHHAQLDHTSLLKYLCDKWGMEPLGARAMAANSISPAIRTTGAARVADTPPFIRVPNQELIPANVAAEQDSTNANSNGLHQFADFLLRSADVLTDDAVIGLTTEVRAWFKLKHDIGKAFVRFGDRLSKDFR
ncbi:MAG TPA: alkaline phosphatase family protein, partial [Pseudonocardiaceae bacterium]|nr:alkaline phosphatase family protein [Pseudonocardiaceae bacterium]